MSLAYLFCAASFCVGSVVLLQQRFDALRGFLAATMIYLFPALMGERDFIFGLSTPSDEAIALTALLISCLTLICLLAPPLRLSTARVSSSQELITFGIFLCLLTSLLFCFYMFKYGPLFFLQTRHLVPLSNTEMLAFSRISTLAFVLGLSAKHIPQILAGIVFLAIVTIMGDRTAATMAVGSWFLLEASRSSCSLLKLLHRYWVVIAGLAVFLLYGKVFYNTAPLLLQGKTVEAGSVYRAITSKPQIIEPIITFEVLNKSLSRDFSLTLDVLHGSFARALPLSDYLGIRRSYSFNRLFQRSLFPSAKRESMAFNLWAEGWAVARLPGVLLVLSGLVSIILILQRVTRFRSCWLFTSVLLASSYTAFYSQRNTLGSSINVSLQWILVAGVLYLAFRVVVQILRSVDRNVGATCGDA